MTKKILFLGASAFQVPAIQYAREKNYYTISIDNIKKNPGHEICNKTFNISTTDKEKVLKIAEDNEISGIVSFGSDVGLKTQAFVAEKMRLPGLSQKSAEIFSNKMLFRKVLVDNKITSIKYDSYNKTNLSKSLILEKYNFPFIVKPVDSSGSKGVHIVRNKNSLKYCLDQAFCFSRSGQIIVEEFIEKKGDQICGDGYILNGKISFIGLGNGLFHKSNNPVPFAEIFPDRLSAIKKLEIIKMSEEILNFIGYGTGVFNIDCFLDKSGKPFIVEIAPRAGGNFLSKAIQYTYGVNIAEICVESSINRGYKLNYNSNYKKRVSACYMIHTKKKGYLKKYSISGLDNILHFEFFAKKDDIIDKFVNSKSTVGAIVFSELSHQKARKKILKMNKNIKVSLRKCL